MQTKTYTINNVNFRLKTDLTLDEAEQVQGLFNNLFIRDGQSVDEEGMVGGSFTNSEIKKFLSIALEPAVIPANSCKQVIEEFDFGSAKESVVIEIIRDFFLYRIKKFQDFTLSCAESIKQH